jgi:predicted GNAT family acetyltransferase
MGTVRELGPGDLSAALRLADSRPVENVLTLAKLRTSGLEPAILGHTVLGYIEDGALVGLLSHGTSLVPVEATAPALAAFARYLSAVRRSGSIVGVRSQTLGLWQRLTDRFPAVWGHPRAVRDSQPILVLEGDPAGPYDPRVAPVAARHLDAYYEAAVAMYTEEIGLSPAEATGGYYRHVRQLLQRGDGYGIVDRGRVIFKTDVSVASGPICQIGGVWLHPTLRGRGLSAPALAATLRLLRRRWPIVSLYVNHYNAPALALYRRLGFRQVGEAATVLW